MPASKKPDRTRVTLAYQKLFRSEDGEVVLQDLANQIFGRYICDDISDQALRTWAGEVKIFKFILNKTFKEQNNNGKQQRESE